MRRGLLFYVGCALILAGSLLAYLTQTAGGIRIQDVRWTGTDGTPMSALLYVPPNATARTPAPGILAVHGYINSRETQDGFAIEFARRGYVVLAMDQTGHGYSGGAARSNGYGGPDGLKYLRGLDIVDRANVGLEGHSMGGWAIVTAAKAAPDDYKAMVLEGSSTGSRLAPEGDARFPRNLALVYSRFDEFSKLMWEVDRAADVTTSRKLWTVFGTTGPVEPGRLYGSIEDGTARTLFTPAVTHPGDHISREAIGYALDWFGRTLKGGQARDAGDQIWIWKEVGTLVGLIGFVALLLGTFDLLLRLPAFARLRAEPVAARLRRDRAWWIAFAVTAIVPAVTFFPFMDWTATWFTASRWFPQAITNQILVWALLNGAITLALSFLQKGVRPRFNNDWLRSLALAVLTAGVGYLALAIVGAVFTVDFRFWVVGLKLLNPTQLGIACGYVLFFTLFFAVALRALHANLSLADDTWVGEYAGAIGGLALGFFVFLLLEYGTLFATGQLLTPGEPLNTIVAIQFVPLLAFIGLVSTFTFRRTNSFWPGAFLCALVVTWYIVAGQATHVRL